MNALFVFLRDLWAAWKPPISLLAETHSCIPGSCLSLPLLSDLPLQTSPSALFFTSLQKKSLSSLWRRFSQFTPLPNPVLIPGSCPAHSTLYNALGLPKLLRIFLFTMLCNVNLSLACQWNRNYFLVCYGLKKAGKSQAWWCMP